MEITKKSFENVSQILQSILTHVGNIIWIKVQNQIWYKIQDGIDCKIVKRLIDQILDQTSKQFDKASIDEQIWNIVLDNSIEK